MTNMRQVPDDISEGQSEPSDPDAVLEHNTRFLEALEIDSDKEDAFLRELNTRIFALPPELQGEILSYMDIYQAKEWLRFRATYGAARARYWKNGITLKSQSEVSKLCDFISADRSENVRTLIQELTFPIVEPLRAPFPIDQPVDNPDMTNLGYYIETSWHDLMPRVETMLSRLGGLKTVIIRTVRPDRITTPTGSTQLTTLKLPDCVEALRFSEPAPNDVMVFNRQWPTKVTMFGTQHANIWSSSNIKLIRPGTGLKSLTFSSAVRGTAHPDYDYPNHGYGGGGLGLDDLQAFGSIETFSLRIGNDAHFHDRIADPIRLSRNLRSLPHLHTLELMAYPYPRSVATRDLPRVFKRDWLSALPSLQVLRVPIRNVMEYVSKTRADDILHIELLITEDELYDPQYYDDWQFVYVFVKLAEECAHYYAQNSSDRRSLTLRPVEDRGANPPYLMPFTWYSSLPPWFSDVQAIIYYPAIPLYDPFYEEGSMDDLKGYFSNLWPEFINAMPGFSDGRGDLYVSAEDDVYDVFVKVGKWDLRRNLGIAWEEDEDIYRAFLCRLANKGDFSDEEDLDEEGTDEEDTDADDVSDNQD